MTSATGRSRGDMLDEAAGRPGELLHREGLGAEADHDGEPIGHVLARRARQGAELSERLFAAVVVDDACGSLQRLGKRPERDAVAVRQAAPLEHERRYPRCDRETRR